MAGVLKKLTRNQFAVYLDVKRDFTFVGSQFEKVDYSTVLDLKVGEQEETMAYVCFANDVTEIKSNNIELPLEIANYEGNPVFDFLQEQIYNLPTGQDAKVPFMFCFGGATKKAWRGIATLTGKDLNAGDGKIAFTLKSASDPEKGTYTGEATDMETVPTFVPSEA